MPSAKQVKMRRGTTHDNDLFTGAEGEVTVDLTVGTLRVHDNIKLGGTALALSDLANVPTNTTFEQRIMNAVQALLAANGGGNGEQNMVIGAMTTSYVNPGPNYLLADGSLKNKADYPDLFAAVGDRYAYDGIGDFVASPQPPVATFGNNVVDSVVAGNTVVYLASVTNKIYTSTNGGNTWTVVSITPTAGVLSRVLHNGSKFVAVGTAGLIATSTDGLTWTLQNVGANAYTTMFTLNGIFMACAVSTTNNLAYSADGVTWTQVTMPGFTTAVPLAGYYSSRLGMYFLGGAAGVLLASTNGGASWTARTTNFSTNVILAIAESPTAIMIGGGISGDTTATSATSTDGVTFSTLVTSAAYAKNRQALIYANNMWISAHTGSFTFSVDGGATWTKTASAIAYSTTVFNAFIQVAGVTYGYCTTGNNSSGGVIFRINADTTVDTLTLINRGPSSAGRLFYNASNSTWYSPATYSHSNGGTTYVSALFSKSTDGLVYRALLSQDASVSMSQSTNSGLAFKANGANTLFLHNTTNTVSPLGSQLYYQTGINGALTQTNIPFGAVNGLMYANGSFVIYGNSNTVATSTDAITWVDLSGAIIDRSFQNMAFFAGLYVAVVKDGAATKVVSSPDLVTWTDRFTYSSGNYINMKVLNNRLFIWNGTSMIYSDNGTTWTVSQYGAGIAYNGSRGGDITYSNGRYVFTNAFVTYSTTDFVTFQLGSTTVAFRTLASNNGTFVAVAGQDTASSGTIYSSKDGVSWTLRQNVSAAMQSVQHDGRGFLAFSNYLGQLWSSGDGIYWNLVGTVGTSDNTSYTTIPFTIPGYISGFFKAVSSSFGLTTRYVFRIDDAKFRIPTVDPTTKYDGYHYIKVA